MPVPGLPQTGEFHVEHSIAGPESSLVRYVLDIFESFKTARRPFEETWEEAWLNYLGQYQDKTAWRSKTEGTGGRSRIFIKLTALKCNTAHAKIVDSLFANGELVPYGLVPLSTNGDPRDAAMAAEEWRKSVLDPHFSRIDLPEIISDATLELAILGTAVLKGPVLAPQRSRVVVDRGAGGVGIETGIEMVASVEHIPLWEYYVDTNAKTPAQSIGEIHFRRMLPQEFRDLAGGGGYDRAAVREAARRASNQDPSDTRYIQMADNYMGEHGVKDARVSSLEFWGLVPAAHLAEAGTLLPEGTEEEDSLEACVCLGADGIVTKAIVNPTGVRPFKVCPYKKRPHQAYGQGVAEAMRDSQKMINSIARLIIDNKALSGNGMVGVNLDRINVKRTKDLSVYPGKTWFIKGNYSPQEAIGTVGFQDVTLGLKDLLEQFERFADEETGIPKYSHGEQGSFLNKMLDVNTPVPMLNGTYKVLADIKDGDSVIGSDGKAVTVAKAHEIHLPDRAYQIKFASGEEITAGGEHLWTVSDAKGKSKTVNTDILFELVGKKKRKLFIPRIRRPMTGMDKELPLDPYILGLWLGDGHSHSSRITTADAEVIEYVKKWAEGDGGGVSVDKTQNSGKAVTYYIKGKAKGNCPENGRFQINTDTLHGRLRIMGLMKSCRDIKAKTGKHIPGEYLSASYSDRLELLRGLMDTDGCHHSNSLVIFIQKEGRLVHDIIKLIESLGGWPRIHETHPGEWAKEGVKYYQVHFSIFDNPFKMEKKASKWKTIKWRADKQRILSVEPVKICKMRCLTVDAKDGLFCVGERFTLTHNTAAGMSMLMAQANLNIKTAMRNIDNAWIEPLVEAFYDWFAGNGSGPRLPFKIKAAGTDSIIAKEIRLENLSKFITAAANPMFAPFVDQAKAIREMGRLLEIDLVRSEEEVAQILAQMQSQNGPGKSLKETVDIDRLYPYLTRAEQMQVLESLGIRPDPALPPGGPGAGGWNGDGNGDGQEHQGAGISPFGAPARV